MHFINLGLTCGNLGTLKQVFSIISIVKISVYIFTCRGNGTCEFDPLCNYEFVILSRPNCNLHMDLGTYLAIFSISPKHVAVRGII